MGRLIFFKKQKMKLTLTIFLFLLMGQSNSSEIRLENEIELSPCPSSPNCVSTKEERRRKRMKPIPFTQDLIFSKTKLKNIIENNSRAKLVKENENYLHYEFKTKIGKFIDDVEFLFDEKTKQIHFRSASRKGWSDMGKNKRRMKKICRAFKK